MFAAVPISVASVSEIEAVSPAGVFRRSGTDGVCLAEFGKERETSVRF